MPVPDLRTVLREQNLLSGESPLTEGEQAIVAELFAKSKQDPRQFVDGLVGVLRKKAFAESQCAQAAAAAENLETMFKNLINGNRHYYRLETVRRSEEGLRAVCRLNGQVREFPIHPDVPVGELTGLKPWEFVAVHQEIVVGTWREDPYLFNSAQGDVVELRGYTDPERRLAHVSDRGAERVVVLDDTLGDVDLPPRSKLILQRDDPSRAIGVVPPEQTRSRFEVPISSLHTRLEDLAGLDEIAERVIEDIMLRIYYPEIRERFRLEALKGILLYSKPGMGKTALMRAIALWLHDQRDRLGFDVVLYLVKPNELKSMWHGEDARIVREELWGPIRARQAMPRERPLILLVVLDEIDSLGKRASASDGVVSSAHSDALEAMLVEIDGMVSHFCGDGPPVYVLCAGMTNRLDRVDEAAKRPGRFDLVIGMPDADIHMAESVMAVYARGDSVPWHLDGRIQTAVDEQEVRARLLRPALARIYPAVVLRYKTDTQRAIDVTAGQIMANVHFKDAMMRAKKRAAARDLREVGTPAVGYDDIVDCLLDVALDLAKQMSVDPQMLIRQLDIKVPVAGIEAVPKSQLEQHRYVVHSA